MLLAANNLFSKGIFLKQQEFSYIQYLGFHGELSSCKVLKRIRISASSHWSSPTSKSNFQLNGKSYPVLCCFCLTSLGYWSRKLTPLSESIGCKTKTNHDLVALLHFWLLHVFTLSSDRLLNVFTFLVGCCNSFGFHFTITINQKGLWQ